MSSYKYDVVLSFAGEDRSYVEEVAALLRSEEVKVFYDDFESTDLWGKDLYEHLHEVYYRKARFCVMFISEHYARKLWTNHERKSAQARAFEEHEEYILPARFDSTAIPGVRTTLGYIDLAANTPIQLVGRILKKIGVPRTSAPPRESWEDYGWLFDVDGYRVAYIPLLNDWRAPFKSLSIGDIEIQVDSERFEFLAEFPEPRYFSNFTDKPSCRLDFYSVRKAMVLELRLKETSYSDYLRSGEQLDHPLPSDPERTFRDEFGRISRNKSGDLRLFDLTNICGVGLFVETSDGYLIATTHSSESHVYPGRMTFSASGTMRWGAFPDPFTEVIRKSEKELNHLVNLRGLGMIGFGVDARKLYFQFSFLEKANASLREIRDFAGEDVALLPIPGSLEQVCDALFQHCWEPAAEAALLTLCAQRFGRDDVAEFLASRKSEYGLREMRDEWDYRSSRPGLLPDMSIRYPIDELEVGSRLYLDAVFNFIGQEVTNKRLLEVGCGTGRFTERLVGMARTLTCVELSDRMIMLCQRRLGDRASQVQFIHGAAQQHLPVSNVDIVLCSLVLIHNVRATAFRDLVAKICASADLIFLFEDIRTGRKTCPHTRLREETDLLQAFEGHGFYPEKKELHSLFKDQIIFLKLAKRSGDGH